MNPNITGCDSENEITGIRCGLDVSVYIDNDQYCKYCAPLYLDEDDEAAVLAFKRAGML